LVPKLPIFCRRKEKEKEIEKEKEKEVKIPQQDNCTYSCVISEIQTKCQNVS
jgi:hypothetical protein